jgi:RNA polymerase sigma-70 factor (ECF subfamily)
VREAFEPASSKAPATDELRLVAALRRRNRKAAAQLIALHSDAVHGYVRSRLVPRTDLVDDLVQEVFLAAWAGIESFGGRSSLRTWLLGIARHKVEDYYRRRLSEPASLPEADEPDPPAQLADTPDFDQTIDRERAQKQTRRILGQLPEEQSLLLLWRYWEKKSAREMAEATGRTEKGIERALARAREQFRRRWDDAERR